MNKIFDLVNLIKADKSALSNREGIKPLFSLAETIRSKTSDFSSTEIEQEIINVDISILSAEEVNTYLSFIYYSEIKDDKILEHLYNYIKNELKKDSDDNLLIKGLLVRFIVERSKNLFSLTELLNETKLKEKNPWIWVDCMSYFNWSSCVNEISKLLSTGNNFKNLLIRMPSYEKKFGKMLLIEAFKKWHPNLTNDDRLKLNKWVLQFEIKFGPSVSAEHLIENAPLLQNQIV